MTNLSFSLDITDNGSSIFSDSNISFNSFKLYYKLWKFPTFSLNLTIYDWRDCINWKELFLSATLYNKYSFRFPITITGMKVVGKNLTCDGLVCYKDNLLIKHSRYLGSSFKSAYKKLKLYQQYNGDPDVDVSEDKTTLESPEGNGFFQLNSTDVDMLLLMLKGISKDYFAVVTCEELKLIKYSDGEFKNKGEVTNTSAGIIFDNLRYSTNIESKNPNVDFQLDPTEVQTDGYFRFLDKTHDNYEYRGLDSYFFNKEFNNNLMYNTKLEDGMEYSHIISFSKYYDIEVGDLLPYPTGINISKLMVTGKEVELQKTSVIKSTLQLGVMKNEIQ